jgi:hypothetical protein
MKILNVDFNENVVWNSEVVLQILQKANKTSSEKELKALIKASKLIKDELPKTTTKSTKGKKKSITDDRNTDNIQ